VVQAFGFLLSVKRGEKKKGESAKVRGKGGGRKKTRHSAMKRNGEKGRGGEKRCS